MNRKNFLVFLSRLRKLPRVDTSLLGSSEEENGFVDVDDESEEDTDSSRGDYSSQPNPNLKPFTARRSEETVITSSSKGMGNKLR